MTWPRLPAQPASSAGLRSVAPATGRRQQFWPEGVSFWLFIYFVLVLSLFSFRPENNHNKTKVNKKNTKINLKNKKNKKTNKHLKKTKQPKTKKSEQNKRTNTKSSTFLAGTNQHQHQHQHHHHHQHQHQVPVNSCGSDRHRLCVGGGHAGALHHPTPKHTPHHTKIQLILPTPHSTLHTTPPQGTLTASKATEVLGWAVDLTAGLSQTPPEPLAIGGGEALSSGEDS